MGRVLHSNASRAPTRTCARATAPANVDRHDLDTIVKLVNERLARERGDARPLASAIAKKTRRAKTPRGAKKLPIPASA